MENLKIKGHKVQLDNNRLTGDTYPIKAWIKEYLCGQWDAETKSWIVDPKQVSTFRDAKYPQIVVDTGARTETKQSDMQRGIWQRNGELTEDF